MKTGSKDVARLTFSPTRLLAAVLAAAVISALLSPGLCPAAWSTWTQWNTNGFGNTNNYSVFELEVYDGDLYAGPTT